MATVFATAQELVDWLNLKDSEGERVIPSVNSDPKLADLERYINFAEDEIKNRLHRTFGEEETVTKEIHDIKNVYEWGQGLPIHLHYPRTKTIASGSGDKIEKWDGTNWIDITASTPAEWIQQEELGIIYMRGFVFSIFRENRLRFTYRYGESSVPNWVKEITLELASIKLLRSSWGLTTIQYAGEKGESMDVAIERWKKHVDEVIERNADMIPIEY